MTWEKSEVMSEFLKLSGEKLLKKTAVEKNPYAEDTKVIEEKKMPAPEKSIIEQAHPEPIYVANSRGDGALVENQIEQQEKMIQMLNKMPTGALVGTYASIAHELVKIANECDKVGQIEAADILTDAAQNLLKTAETFPFEKAPVN